MDPIELLRDQHKEISRLFIAVKGAQGQAKEGAIAQLADAVAVHMLVEERNLYELLGPRIAEVSEVLDEHLLLKRKMAELLQCDPSSPIFALQFESFRAQLIQHFGEEEREIFAIAIGNLFPEELEELASSMLETCRDLEGNEPTRAVLSEPAVAAPLQ